jgi:hypothetical protein
MNIISSYGPKGFNAITHRKLDQLRQSWYKKIPKSLLCDLMVGIKSVTYYILHFIGKEIFISARQGENIRISFFTKKLVRKFRVFFVFFILVFWTSDSEL